MMSLFDLTPTVVLIWALLTAGVHIAFAIGVWNDAKAGEREGLRAYFVTPTAWAAAVLSGGPLAAGIYWLIHHSTLRRS